MADSKRQQIIEALDTRLKTIKKTSGYKSDIGNHVYDWLDRDLDDSELPALIYRDRTNPIESYTVLNYLNQVNVEIEVKAKSASTTAESVREMIEDVYKAIGTDDRFGGLAVDSQPVSDEINISHEDKIKGTGTINIIIEYEKEKWGF